MGSHEPLNRERNSLAPQNANDSYDSNVIGTSSDSNVIPFGKIILKKIKNKISIHLQVLRNVSWLFWV